MLGWRAASTILGVRMQAEQSSVGKVLSNWAMRPPMEASFSTRKTWYPASAMASAAWMPAMPPPTTSETGVTNTSRSVSGSWQATRWTAAVMRVLALAVPTALFLVIQEQCSRRLAIANR